VKHRRCRPVEILEARQYFAAISFQPHVDIAAGGAASVIVAADFNGDGKMDVALAESSKVNVFLGNGAGGFPSAPIALTLTAPASSMVVGDFNGDGSPDLAVGTIAASGMPGTGVTIFLNTADGTGNFSAGQSSTIIAGPPVNEATQIVAGDFNGDGKLDVAAANFSDGSVIILPGNGNGTFQQTLHMSVGTSPTAITAGDYNGDGKPDLAVALQHNNVEVVTPLINVGGATFQAKADVSINGTGVTSLASRDMDGNGTIDLIVGSTDGKAAVFVNNGAAAFLNSATVEAAGPVAAVATGDFNFDGAIDLVSANGGNQTTPGVNSVTVGTGNGLAAFSAVNDFSTGTQPISVAVADFNGDSKPDLVTANAGGSTFSVLINNTTGTVLKATTTTVASSNTSAPFGEALQFTATIVAAAGVTLPTGTVRFFDGATLLGTADITDATNTAVFTTSTLGVGTHHIVARYLGDGAFSPSVSTNVILQTITPTPGNGPDLAVSFVSTTLPNQFVRGEVALARFRITNIGNTIALGAIKNALYLSLDNSIDAGDISLTVRGSLAAAHLALPAGRSVDLVGAFTVPADISLNDYVLLASVNTTQSLLESDRDDDLNNTAVSTGSALTAVDFFGNVGGRARVGLTVNDPDGTPVTYLLIGPGTGSVVMGDNGVDLTLTGTTAATSLIILARPGAGNGIVDLHDITASGAIGVLRGQAVNVTGDVTLSGGVKAVFLKSFGGVNFTLGNGPAAILSLGNVSAATLTSASGIQLLSVSTWTGGGVLSAPWIGTLLSRDQFAPNLTLSGAGSPGGAALNVASVLGQVTDSTWSITGDARRISIGAIAGTNGSRSVSGRVSSFIDGGDFTGNFAAGSFGTILIRGNLSGGDILAGASFGPDARLGGGDDTFAAGSIGSLLVLGSAMQSLVAAGIDPVDGTLLNGNDQLISGGSIAAINVSGNVDDATRFLAAQLPVRARLGGVVVTTASDPHFK